MKILLSAVQKQQYYVDAVIAAGAEPTLLCRQTASPDAYDGLIICGGSDIDPKYFGEENTASVGIDAERDAAEFELADSFIKAGKPVMGICRGMQLLNIYFGGKLCQHIDCADMHKHPDCDLVHEVRANEGSILHSLYGDVFSVNSKHHQAVNVLGEGLVATVFSDSITEAFEHKALPVFGVQWHPERMCGEMARTDTVDGSAIFEYFIALCKKELR